MCRAIASLALILSSFAAHAALHGRLPATPAGTDYQAYYDDALHITWLADANLAVTNAFGVVSGINASDGTMTWSTAVAWITGMRNANYLGVGNWRLPATTQPDASCRYQFDAGGSFPLQGFDLFCTGSEMGHLSNVDGISVAAPTPFTNVQGAASWSGTDFAPDTTGAWGVRFDTGDQHPYFKETQALHAWAVRWGDIGVANPNADADGDLMPDDVDNCTLVANPAQLDTDGDGYGNICDGDLNNSGLTTATDFNLLRSCLNLPATSSALCAAADMNGSGLVTATDFNLLRARINSAPGPSGLHP